MMNLDKIASLFSGNVTIQCPKMEIIARDNELPLAVGEGEVECLSDFEFRYRMTGKPIDLGHSLKVLNRLRDDPFESQNMFRLILTDQDGTQWQGGWTEPHVNFESIPWRLNGTCESLITHGEGGQKGEARSQARFIIPRDQPASIILRRFLNSNGSSSHHDLTACGTAIRFSFEPEMNVLTISAASTDTLPAHFAENWLGEPLRILFGQSIYPRFVERRFDDGGSMLSVRRTLPWTQNSAWIALWDSADRLTNANGFFELYSDLLTLIASGRDLESHAVTTYYEQVVEASQGSRWVLAMTLSSSIEGIARILVPRGTLKHDANEKAINSLIAHIDTWAGPDRLKSAAIDHVKRADVASAGNALRDLSKKGIGTNVQVKHWTKMRNSVMHGELISPYSSKKDDEIIIELSNLLKALTREAARQSS